MRSPPERVPVAIFRAGTVSPLGPPEAQDAAWSDTKTYLRRYGGRGARGDAFPPVGALRDADERLLESLAAESPRGATVDRSQLMGMLAARRALEGFELQDDQVAVNIGCSRGPTALWERHHETHLDSRPLPAATSPETTLGSLSSGLARALGMERALSFSHSVTCSSGLHAIANGCAWLRSGMIDAFLAGGAEAPLTSFTMAQMQALRILSREHDEFPCRPLARRQPSNTVCLGEGASVFLMKLWSGGDPAPLAIVESIGWSQESSTTATSIDPEGAGLQESMAQAIDRAATSAPIDLVIAHAPGTRRGDSAEMHAIRRVLATDAPTVTSNKWKIGHALGASGSLSLSQALYLIGGGSVPPVPYDSYCSVPPGRVRKILVNAAGFGGNAVSVVVSSPELF